jgi:hypothetical protein
MTGGESGGGAARVAPPQAVVNLQSQTDVSAPPYGGSGGSVRVALVRATSYITGQDVIVDGGYLAR